MGWIKFIKECKAIKNKKDEIIPHPPIKPILGIEVYIARKMDIGQYEGDRKKIKSIQPDGRKGNKHMTLYAMNYKGYQNICTLSQRSWTKGFYHNPRIDIELLSEFSEGVMAGTACLAGLVNTHLLIGNYDKAKKICGVFKDILKDNFFLELMYQGMPQQQKIIGDIIRLSNEMDIPVLATQDVHYIRKKEAFSQEILMCMSTNRCIKDENRISHSYDEFYLKSAKEMAKIFKSYPQALYNTIKLAERIDSDDIEKNLFGGMRLPNFEIPSEYKNSYDYLTYLAWEGLKKHKWDKSEPHIKALKRELEDVKIAKDNNNYDFAKYFLIVRDYIKAARDIGALIGPGRGSGYASVLLRCLDITYGVDPLEYDLIWERFLGFDTKRFINESDFGFENKNNKLELENNELMEDRELKDDLGGVDRY